MKIRKRAWRAGRGVLLGLVALVMFIEEWGWRPLSAALARLARWPPLGRLEARIARVPPRVALVLFLVPALLLFPVKLLALWFIHGGRAVLGIVVILAAKLLGTALVGRLFVLTEPQLRRIAWFARALRWWHRTGHRIRRIVRAAIARSRLWRRGRRAMRRWRSRLRRWVA